MWAVYFCGPTDCFLQAMFVDQNDALDFMNTHKREQHSGDGGGYLEWWPTPDAIDRTDTGWEP